MESFEERLFDEGPQGGGELDSNELNDDHQMHGMVNGPVLNSSNYQHHHSHHHHHSLLLSNDNSLNHHSLNHSQVHSNLPALNSLLEVGNNASLVDTSQNNSNLDSDSAFLQQQQPELNPIDDFEEVLKRNSITVKGKIYCDWSRLTQKYSKPKTSKKHWNEKLDLSNQIIKDKTVYIPLKQMLPFFESKLCVQNEEYIAWNSKCLEEKLLGRESQDKKDSKRKRQEKISISSLGLQSSCRCKTILVEPSSKRRALKDILSIHNQADQVKRVKDAVNTFEEMLNASDQQLKSYLDIYAHSEKDWFVERINNFISRPRNRTKVESLLKSTESIADINPFPSRME
eukprot:TRINITY_DN4836_c0_g2_i1.p1 TRINITY_DN4836_c0_g2~~TRINITY_DN4836_c0_g2_i1.p1  ORF type:complete len:343 (+),score=120.93 TRINITY_DN4836_c0_g2_i1:180-1208(+)